MQEIENLEWSWIRVKNVGRRNCAMTSVCMLLLNHNNANIQSDRMTASVKSPTYIYRVVKSYCNSS